MRILVIPDIHLKPWIVKYAKELNIEQAPDATVFLGDIADDWNKQSNIGLYEKTFDAVIQYCREYKDSTWFCYGNHDISYEWNVLQSGFSSFASTTVRIKLDKLRRTLPYGHVAFIHYIDGVLFSHAGLVQSFASRNEIESESLVEITEEVNRLNKYTLWDDDSPLWVRPQGKQTENSDIV